MRVLQNLKKIPYKKEYIYIFLNSCWTIPGGNTPQSTNYTTTYLPSWKLSKLDEPDMQDIAGEAGMSS